jgi:acetyl-CoA acetyltransferase
MTNTALRDKYAIAGVGYTPQGKVPGRSALSFYLEACVNAIKDAGLTKDDIDGLICYRHFPPLLNDYEVTPYLVAHHLGITPTVLSQEANCARNHLAQAISLIEAGFCKHVLIVYGDNAFSGRRTFTREFKQGMVMEDGAAYGEFSAMSKYAMAARRAMYEYNTGPDTWKEIACSQRAWANLNPNAVLHHKTLSHEDYLAAEWIVEPFRIFDATHITDGGRAIIVTSTERARDLKQPVVSIMGISEFNQSVDIFQSKSLAGPTGAKQAGEMAMKMAGITVDEIDAAQVYDCFTYTVEVTLQDYGFFKPGEGKDWYGDGRTRPGGELPVNTSGGLLSEAYFMGLTPFSEGVMQLMGRCGERQLGPKTNTKEPEIILCGDNGAYFHAHCAAILRRQS